MILSSTAEFTPWVIQPKKENQFTELTNLSRPINLEEHKEEVELSVSENMTTDDQDVDLLESSTPHDDEVSVSQNDTDIGELRNLFRQSFYQNIPLLNSKNTEKPNTSEATIHAKKMSSLNSVEG